MIVTIADIRSLGFKRSQNSCCNKCWKQFQVHLEVKIERKFQFADKLSGDEFASNAIVTNPERVVDKENQAGDVLYRSRLKYFERSGLFVNTYHGRGVETPIR